MIIGAPKNITEVPSLGRDDINAFVQNCDAMLQSGTPPEIPLAVPLQQMVLIGATLMRYRQLVKELADCDVTVGEAMTDEDVSRVLAAVTALQTKAVELTGSTDRVVVTPQPVTPPSRLIIPE
jgi:hypothetical protein